MKNLPTPKQYHEAYSAIGQSASIAWLPTPQQYQDMYTGLVQYKSANAILMQDRDDLKRALSITKEGREIEEAALFKTIGKLQTERADECIKQRQFAEFAEEGNIYIDGMNDTAPEDRKNFNYVE